MKSWIIVLFLTLSFFIVNDSLAADDYYARCNLKVLKGNQITWVNWQASPTFIPAGTKLKVTRNGSNATFVRADTGESYSVDLGADGDIYLEKFVTKQSVKMSTFPEDIQSHIKSAVAKVGMTKEQVYIAMGPPSKIVSGRTDNMTYDQIMNADQWDYSRRRFGKNIGVAFDPNTGKVNRTEGIWGKE